MLRPVHMDLLRSLVPHISAWARVTFPLFTLEMSDLTYVVKPKVSTMHITHFSDIKLFLYTILNKCCYMLYFKMWFLSEMNLPTMFLPLNREKLTPNQAPMETQKFLFNVTIVMSLFPFFQTMVSSVSSLNITKLIKNSIVLSVFI